MIRTGNINYLELHDFEILVKQLSEAKEDFAQDMPPFKTRYEGRLESIISQLQSVYFGTELYPSLQEKASRLFYSVMKNHPFLNGNKRMAVASMFAFLAINVEELYFDEETINNELFEIAVLTAASLPEQLDVVIDMLNIKVLQYTQLN